MKWVEGAKSVYDLDIDYVGIWNERPYDITVRYASIGCARGLSKRVCSQYILTLRDALDAAGFEDTAIVAADGNWDIANDILENASLAAAVGVIGVHYPGTQSPAAAEQTGKPLWASEDMSTYNDLRGAGACVRGRYIGAAGALCYVLLGALQYCIAAGVLTAAVTVVRRLLGENLEPGMISRAHKCVFRMMCVIAELRHGEHDRNHIMELDSVVRAARALECAFVVWRANAGMHFPYGARHATDGRYYEGLPWFGTALMTAVNPWTGACTVAAERARDRFWALPFINCLRMCRFGYFQTLPMFLVRDRVHTVSILLMRAATFDDCGVLACSGNYDTDNMGVLWASAHTTQFSAPGWHYLSVGRGSGMLTQGGSYVTLASPSGVDFTIVIEKMAWAHSQCIRPGVPEFATAPETATFHLAGPWKATTSLHVWVTLFGWDGMEQTVSSFFEVGPDVTVVNGAFSVSVPVDAIITLTTIATGHKGTFAPPPAASIFPTPYVDSFDSYPLFSEASYFADQARARLRLPMPRDVLTPLVPCVTVAGWRVGGYQCRGSGTRARHAAGTHCARACSLVAPSSYTRYRSRLCRRRRSAGLATLRLIA